ncbi:hypothetical protein H8959_006715 [Pygathrix nigripes]
MRQGARRWGDPGEGGPGPAGTRFCRCLPLRPSGVAVVAAAPAGIPSSSHSHFPASKGKQVGALLSWVPRQPPKLDCFISLGPNVKILAICSGHE